MRRLAWLLLALAALPLAAQTIVIRNVNVVSMTSPKVMEKQNVVVRDGRIVDVSTKLMKLPEGTRVIDGSGQYLMPGLAEMHGHVPPLNAPNGATEDTLFLYVANGITTVRGMLGHPGQLDLHRELLRMREAGMTPYEIIQSGTVNVGRYFARSDTFGRVAAGHRADLILLAADPLKDVANIARINGVMVRGRWLSREDLDQGLAAIAKKYAR